MKILEFIKVVLTKQMVASVLYVIACYLTILDIYMLPVLLIGLFLGDLLFYKVKKKD